jgi:hypothetical protein
MEGREMRRSSLLWGLLLVLVGLLFLLDTLGYLPIGAGALLWPLILIFLGAATLIGAFYRGPASTAKHLSIPLEGSGRARVEARHGAGRVSLGTGQAGGNLLEGEFGGGVDKEVRRQGDSLEVILQSPVGRDWPFTFPWGFNAREGFNWDVRMNPEIPFEMVWKTGASETTLDFTHLRPTHLLLETGASKTVVYLPVSAGQMEVSARGGAASIEFIVPAGVAARIRPQGGLTDVKVDQGRFPRRGGIYQSDDYDTSPNRIDMQIELGVGSLVVR